MILKSDLGDYAHRPCRGFLRKAVQWNHIRFVGVLCVSRFSLPDLGRAARVLHVPLLSLEVLGVAGHRGPTQSGDHMRSSFVAHVRECK